MRSYILQFNLKKTHLFELVNILLGQWGGRFLQIVGTEVLSSVQSHPDLLAVVISIMFQIGLAVGDIASIRRNAHWQNWKAQVDVINFYPKFILRRIFRTGIHIRPNQKGRIQRLFPYISYCVNSVQIWSTFWSVFSCIRTEYGDLRWKSLYSVRMQENTDQKNSVFGLFLCILINLQNEKSREIFVMKNFVHPPEKDCSSSWK